MTESVSCFVQCLGLNCRVKSENGGRLERVASARELCEN